MEFHRRKSWEETQGLLEELTNPGEHGRSPGPIRSATSIRPQFNCMCGLTDPLNLCQPAVSHQVLLVGYRAALCLSGVAGIPSPSRNPARSANRASIERLASSSLWAAIEEDQNASAKLKLPSTVAGIGTAGFVDFPTLSRSADDDHSGVRWAAAGRVRNDGDGCCNAPRCANNVASRSGFHRANGPIDGCAGGGIGGERGARYRGRDA